MPKDMPQLLSLKRYLSTTGYVSVRSISITNLFYRFILYFVCCARAGLNPGYLMSVRDNALYSINESEMVIWIVDEIPMMHKHLTDCGLYLMPHLSPLEVAAELEGHFPNDYVKGDWPGAMYIIKPLLLTQRDKNLAVLNKWRSLTVADLVKVRTHLRQPLFNYAMEQIWK